MALRMVRLLQEMLIQVLTTCISYAAKQRENH